MKKIIILDYFSGDVIVSSIDQKLLEKYDGNIKRVLEQSIYYNEETCYWITPHLDEFGNFNVINEVLY